MQYPGVSAQCSNQLAQLFSVMSPTVHLLGLCMKSGLDSLLLWLIAASICQVTDSALSLTPVFLKFGFSGSRQAKRKLWRKGTLRKTAISLPLSFVQVVLFFLLHSCCSE